MLNKLIFSLERRMLLDASALPFGIESAMESAEQDAATEFIQQYLKKPNTEESVLDAHRLYLAAGAAQHEAFADWNADGVLDHAILVTDSISAAQSVYLRYGVAGGGWVHQSAFQLGTVDATKRHFSSILTVDLDGDGPKEIVVTGRLYGGSDQIRIINIQHAQTQPVMHDVTNVSAYSSLLPLVNKSSFFVADMGVTYTDIADLNGDGRLDMYRSGSNWGSELHHDILSTPQKIEVNTQFMQSTTSSVFAAQNTAPKFATTVPSSVEVIEGSLEIVTTSTASDVDGNSLTYSIAGQDSSAFTINQQGDVQFVVAPDFENPTDVNHDNLYQVILQVSDGQELVEKSLSIAVQDKAAIVPQLTLDDPNGDEISKNSLIAVYVPHYTQSWVYRYTGQAVWSTPKYGVGNIVLQQGQYTDFTVRSVDHFGEVSEQVFFSTLIIDLTVPALPTISKQAFNTSSALLSGYAEKNAQVQMTLHTGQQVSVDADATGYWQWQAHALNEGQYPLYLSAQDVAGNVSGVFKTVFEIDFTAPVLQQHAVSTDNTINASEVAAGVMFSGLSDFGQLVQFTLDAFTAEAIAHNGQWQVFVPSSYLSQEGEQQIFLTASDAAGNVTNVKHNIWVDTVAPKIAQQNDNFWQSALLNMSGVPIDDTVLFINQPQYQLRTEILDIDGSVHRVDLNWGRFTQTQYIVATDVGAVSIVFTLPSRNLLSGKQAIELRVTDQAGNIGLLRSGLIHVYRPIHSPQEEPVDGFAVQHSQIQTVNVNILFQGNQPTIERQISRYGVLFYQFAYLERKTVVELLLEELWQKIFIDGLKRQ